MNLSISLEEGDPVDIFLDGKRYRCGEGDTKILQKLPPDTQVEIRQAEAKLYWFLFPIYLLLGLIIAVLHGLAQEEISARSFLHPLLWRCGFSITNNTDATLTVFSSASSVDKQGTIQKGNLTIIGEGVSDIEYSTQTNGASFKGAYILLCATLFFPLLVLLAVFLLLIFSSTGVVSVIGAIICAIISIALITVCGIKLSAERRMLTDLQAALDSDSSLSKEVTD